MKKYNVEIRENMMNCWDNPVNEDRWNECSEGIHFFINRQESVEY